MTTIFAHRGYHQFDPENSMGAFKKAVLRHVEGIETDVHLTKDQVPVLIHNESLKKMTGDPRKVNDLTLRQIKQLRLQNSKETIPTLEEFLSYLKSVDYRGALNLEIKTDHIHYPNIENIAVEMVNHYQGKYRVIFSSFYVPSIMRIHKLTGLEIACVYRWNGKTARELYRQGVVSSMHPRYLVAFKEKNAPVRPWTINGAFQIRNCFRHNLSGFFTDKYDLALKLKDDYKKRTNY